MKKYPAIAVLWATAACAPGFMAPVEQQDVSTPAAIITPDLSPSRGPGFAPPVRPVLDLNQTRPDFPPPPPPTARTVEDFDTTTAEDRQAAVVTAPQSGERRLGTTIASLGSPTDPGIWFKTPLVTAVTQGRIEYEGNSVAVELRPSGGAAGSGSQISLAAMRLIEAPLTGLPEVVVYAN
ncbi:hypothetical protein [Pseudooctadecabacter sp.]|uniref:hypothetical protein n=1 Tax=Pseudooctadecabacter sp. TaxID=1966338 RepID=UPI0035C7EDFE